MNKFAQSKKTKPPKKRGFALVLSLALISFVFLLVITLVSQVRQDMAYSDARENLILAKANARMGMMIAIGEIQKHLGPDMSISTSADIYDERLDSLISERNESVDLNGNANPIPDELPEGQRMWTGVWKHRGIGSSNHAHEEDERKTYPLPFNSDDASWLPTSWSVDYSYDHHPAVEMAWLVSGNEGKKLGLFDRNNKIIEHVEVPDGRPMTDEQTRLLPLGAGNEYGRYENPWRDHENFVKEKIKTYYHPLLELPNPDTNDTVAWLFKSDYNNTEFKKRNSVKVPKAPIFLSKQINSWENRHGAYAYWVSDEGIKTKINFNHNFSLSSESKVTLAPHPNVDSGSFELNSIADERKRILSINSIPLFEENSDGGKLENFLLKHYHDITANSFGVLADLRTGGLKRDLSLAFAQLESQSQTSASIANDFNDNFMFRERIVYKKNLPLFGANTYRNTWLTQEDAPINDDNVLLAGPRWSVLADFHNLHATIDSNTNLNLTGPMPFPRANGDNAVIFSGNPRDGRGTRLLSRENTTLFNVGDDAKLRHRPEPKNHSLLPVLLKLRMGVCPVMIPRSNKFHVAILPKVTLWNPYSEPLSLNNLFFEVPGGISTESYVLDLEEYDLYRKWWVAMYATGQYDVDYQDNGFPFALGHEDYFQRYFKFEPSYGLPVNDPEAYPGRLGAMTGLDSPVLNSVESVYNNNEFYSEDDLRSENTFAFEMTNLNFFQWNNGRLPASIFKAKRAKSEDFNAIFHENSDVAHILNTQPKFTFFSHQKNKQYVKKIRLQIVSPDYQQNSSVINPGEVVNFSCFSEISSLDNPQKFSFDRSKYNIQEGSDRLELEQLIIMVCRENPSSSIEHAFMWEHNLESPTQLYRIYINMHGFADSTSTETRTYNRANDTFTYTAPSEGTALSMFSGDPLIRYDPTQGNSPKLLTKYSNWSVEDKAKPVKSTAQYLRANFDNLGGDKQPGWGWEVAVKMPGDKSNERILLNEFNMRALVHSSQHGKGVWFGSTNIYDHNDSGFDVLYSDVAEPLTSSDFQFNGKTFKLGKFPHFYNIPQPYPLNDPEDVVELANTLEEYAEELNTPGQSTFQRAMHLRFDREDNFASVISSRNQGTLLADPDLNDQKNTLREEDATIPRSWSVTSEVGFFLQSYHEPGDDLNFYENTPRSNTAVMFEIPQRPPLSLLQYKHANFNSYLHSPNYALGNSYATTQVARHRSWARINHVSEEPSNRFEMGSLRKNLQLQKDGVTWATRLFKTLYPPAGSRDNRWENKLNDHFRKRERSSNPQEARFHIINGEHTKYIDWPNIDPSEGYTPWRSNSSSHQNIAFDHSYYLNRALLDGYFLSGAKDRSMDESSYPESVNERWYPYLSDSKTYGNSRLMKYQRPVALNAYIRNGQFDTFFYNGEKNNENIDSELDLFFAQQSPVESNNTGYTMLHHHHLDDSIENKEIKNDDLLYQTSSADLLNEGSFNINSTSIDSWIAQLSSLRGIALENTQVLPNETPVTRFLKEPISDEENKWNTLRKLSDNEVYDLAKEIVRQVKLRGPFLSVADFINRRLIGGPNVPGKSSLINFATLAIDDWIPENQDSVTGLRGAVQSAIAMSGLNDPEDSNVAAWINKNKLIPSIPTERWHSTGGGNGIFHDSSFGLLATSKQSTLSPDQTIPRTVGLEKIEIYNDFKTQTDEGIDEVHDHRVTYPGQGFGDAPENILAVESLATGAAKPGWVMQADILSPLLPSMAARSDTFVIRVLGETNSKNRAKTWIEAVVQRTPDYVKPDIDAPHHRPHERFMDQNLNGFWDEAIDEPWTNLNYNKTAYPDLPGDKNSHFRDGMPSDLSLNLDPQEEDIKSSKGISIIGVNQRFGRKFRIVSFRWLKEQDV